MKRINPMLRLTQSETFEAQYRSALLQPSGACQHCGKECHGLFCSEACRYMWARENIFERGEK